MEFPAVVVVIHTKLQKENKNANSDLVFLDVGRYRQDGLVEEYVRLPERLPPVGGALAAEVSFGVEGSFASRINFNGPVLAFTQRLDRIGERGVVLTVVNVCIHGSLAVVLLRGVYESAVRPYDGEDGVVDVFRCRFECLCQRLQMSQ